MATASIAVAVGVAEAAGSGLSGVAEPQAARPKTMMAAEIAEVRMGTSSRLSKRNKPTKRQTVPEWQDIVPSAPRAYLPLASASAWRWAREAVINHALRCPSRQAYS